MTSELRKQLKTLSNKFYDWLKQSTIENWREQIPDPIDTFCNYDDEAGVELSKLYSEYENDKETTAEIDKYLNIVVEAVNNGTVIEQRGGVREGAGRKLKSKTGKAVTISFSCSPEQKEQIKKDIVQSGMTQSEYIINKLL